VFRRRNKDQPDVEPDTAAGADGAADDLDDDAEVDAPGRAVVRPEGPYDVSEVPEDGITRLDLGGLRVPGAEGMELRLELDEASEVVQAVTVVHGDSTMQLMAFAAPRTDGIWDDVREEIRKSLASQGLVDQVESAWGTELHATLTVTNPQGQSVMQPVRFVGIDGPRWFVRALFGGRAAREAEAAAGLEAVLRACVVVRGTDPMAPGDPLPLQVPGEVPEGITRNAEPEERDDRPPLTMPARGPEITEIR
jgi:hypothetical protein